MCSFGRTPGSQAPSGSIVARVSSFGRKTAVHRACRSAFRFAPAIATRGTCCLAPAQSLPSLATMIFVIAALLSVPCYIVDPATGGDSAARSGRSRACGESAFAASLRKSIHGGPDEPARGHRAVRLLASADRFQSRHCGRHRLRLLEAEACRAVALGWLRIIPFRAAIASLARRRSGRGLAFESVDRGRQARTSQRSARSRSKTASSVTRAWAPIASRRSRSPWIGSVPHFDPSNAKRTRTPARSGRLR